MPGLIMSFISTASAKSEAIVICVGDNAFPNGFYVEVSREGLGAAGYSSQNMPEMAWSGPILDAPMISLSRLLRSQLSGLADILPSCVASIQKGDITDPQPRVWNYNKDVMSLACNAKQDEVISSEELLFGVELEFNHSSYTLQELSPLLGMGIFKHDSSVDGEYVTLPYTYKELVQKVMEIGESFDKLLSANKDLTGHSGVGMHVHISRKGLAPEQLKFLRELFGTKYDREVSYLCNRYPNRWCEYQPFNGSRYVAFNEANSATVEIRAFLSPSSAAGVLRNLMLIKSWLDKLEFPKVSKEVLDDWWGDKPLPTKAPFGPYHR
jgi:hypothetical protein